MGKTSSIEWTGATWNPWHGCHKISAGCKNCYMFRDKARYGQDPNVVVQSKTQFGAPLHWKEPRLIFTCSWSDFFIEEADDWRVTAWEIIRRTPRHTYQILTKRADRMAGRVPDPPLPNVWLGVSVEDQKRADERIPQLLRTPAAVRFLSVEPLLGPVDLTVAMGAELDTVDANGERIQVERAVDWVICGGESGPEARPMDPSWARGVRDQCVDADVPFFFKQWGEWAPGRHEVVEGCVNRTNGRYHFEFDPTQRGQMVKLGKKAAGRLLDGRTWDQMPGSVLSDHAEAIG